MVRKDLLAWMVQQCRDGLEGDKYSNMVDSTICMLDLTDDETSPSHNISQDEVVAATLHHQRAFDFAMDLYERRNAARADAQPDAEADPQNMDDESSESDELENGASRIQRYMNSRMEEVSDVEYWTELHYGE